MKKQIILAAAISAALSVSAFAAPSNGPAKSGLYIGGNLGAGNIAVTQLKSDKTGSDIPKASGGKLESDYHFVWGLFAGYQYAVTPNVALGAELGYNDNGYSESNEFSKGGVSSKNKYTSKDVELLAVGKYYINNQFNVFAKGGIARVTENSVEETMSIKTNKVSNDYIGYAPKVVVGVGYSPITNVDLTLEYDHIFGSDNANTLDDKDSTSDKFNTPKGVASVNAVKAGVTYTLPM